ncbi:hypothetical protein GUITHDRAFT_155774, partial [Guillardia theta CCMP2712]
MTQSCQERPPSSMSHHGQHACLTQMQLLEDFGNPMCVPAHKELFDDFFGVSPGATSPRHISNTSMPQHGSRRSMFEHGAPEQLVPNLEPNGSFTAKKMFRRRSSSLSHQGFKISCDEIVSAARQDSRLSELLCELKQLPASLMPASITSSMREMTWDQFRMFYFRNQREQENNRGLERACESEDERWPEQSQWIGLMEVIGDSQPLNHPHHQTKSCCHNHSNSAICTGHVKETTRRPFLWFESRERTHDFLHHNNSSTLIICDHRRFSRLLMCAIEMLT